MKFSASFVLIVIVALVATGSALPAKKRLVYFQQPNARFSAGPQRMMYVKYVKPGSYPFARSTQGAEVLVAGDTVATGTFLRDCDHAEADISAAGPAVDVASQEQAEDVLSEAAAYPASPAVELEAPVYSVPAEVDIVAQENDSALAAEDSNGSAAEADLPAPAPLVPVAKPSRKYVPASKKKVFVELDQSVETEDDTSATEEEEEEEVVPVPPRRKIAKKPVKASSASSSKADKPLPSGTFFPIDFGGTAGGAIAIANSFSTGEGGSATSHAVAYGSPEAARARVRPSKKH